VGGGEKKQKAKERNCHNIILGEREIGKKEKQNKNKNNIITFIPLDTFNKNLNL